MSRYRDKLPQMDRGFFITDGGIETTLIFHEGFELPYFAAFDLLKTPDGEAALRHYFQTYAEIAVQHNCGCVLESATWRANSDWAEKMGYSIEALVDANCKAIEILVDVRRRLESKKTPMVISGCIGPRGDGYDPAVKMTVDAARKYHAAQIETFRTTAADLVTAITMNYVEEAVGITNAAAAAGMPVVISFTVETDGHLPTGQPLEEAIETVDSCADKPPVYYMINCAHPDHFRNVLVSGSAWTNRIRGLRANASRCSHAELNDAVELDDGDPQEFGQLNCDLIQHFPEISVVGGCCGTDHRHVEAVCKNLEQRHGVSGVAPH